MCGFYFLLLGCFLSELLVHTTSSSSHIFPLLWYFCMLVWLTKEKTIAFSAGLITICWAPLFGISLDKQLMYVAFIMLNSQILSTVFAPTRLVIMIFSLFSLMTFAFCMYSMSPLCFLINLAVLAFLLLIVFYLLDRRAE